MQSVGEDDDDDDAEEENFGIVFSQTNQNLPSNCYDDEEIANCLKEVMKLTTGNSAITKTQLSSFKLYHQYSKPIFRFHY